MQLMITITDLVWSKKVLVNKHISDGVKAKAVNRLARNKFAQVSKGTYISTKNSQNN